MMFEKRKAQKAEQALERLAAQQQQAAAARQHEHDMLGRSS
jgi:hypothetical protein